MGGTVKKCFFTLFCEQRVDILSAATDSWHHLELEFNTDSRVADLENFADVSRKLTNTYMNKRSLFL